jgi:tripartite-type tricarboxylate transporter receptor subunit TctC
MGLDRRGFLALATAATVLDGYWPAEAQTYPTQRIRIIVPFAAGGPTDIVARLISQKLPQPWAQQVYVENIPAGSSNVGTDAAAKARADGYTILFVSGNIVVNPSLFNKVAWDPVRDFAPISLLATSAHVLSVHPSVPARSVGELVALLKANPGKYTYASPGLGTTAQLAAELFKLSVGVDLAYVPFNGASPAVVSTLGGHTPILFSALPQATPNVKDGKLRALSVTSHERSAALPDVPTMGEAGFPGQESIYPQGLLAPAGTPEAIIDLWHRETARILALADVKARLAAIGFDPVASSPEEFGAWIKAEVPRWAKVIRDVKIQRIE